VSTKRAKSKPWIERTQIGHRYFDTGRYKSDLICKIECSSYLVEYDMAQHYRGLLGDRQLGIGAIDVQDPKVESGDLVASRVRAHNWLDPEQTIVTSSCGFNHLPQKTAFGKLKAMTGERPAGWLLTMSFSSRTRE